LYLGHTDIILKWKDGIYIKKVRRILYGTEKSMKSQKYRQMSKVW